MLDRDDENHEEASKIWAHLLERGHRLLTHSYVLVETFALVQRRLGLEAVRALHQDLLPVVEILPVDEALHQAAVETLLASGSRSVSLSRSGELLPHAAAGDSDRFRLRPGFPA